MMSVLGDIDIIYDRKVIKNQAWQKDHIPFVMKDFCCADVISRYQEGGIGYG
jgi:hypothetical protein